jgi:hypothetical protein
MLLIRMFGIGIILSLFFGCGPETETSKVVNTACPVALFTEHDKLYKDENKINDLKTMLKTKAVKEEKAYIDKVVHYYIDAKILINDCWSFISRYQPYASCKNSKSAEVINDQYFKKIEGDCQRFHDQYLKVFLE